MTGLGDSYTAEIYGQDIEGGIGRTLEDTSQSANERVGSVGGHGIDHQTSGTASAQWLHDGCWESAYKVAVDTTKLHGAFNASYEVIHGS